MSRFLDVSGTVDKKQKGKYAERVCSLKAYYLGIK